MRPLPVDSLKNFMRSLLGAGSLAALLLAFTAAPASASACGQRVLDDWYDDGNVAATYPIHCYREAIADLPEDVQSYSSAEEDISAAMLAAIAANERDKKKDNAKGPRKDPADREKQAGAREYAAKRHDRKAETLDEQGDAAGAQAERDEAAALREPSSRLGKRP